MRMTTKRMRRSIPLEERLPSAAALFPWTSELGELVNGINTSQIPISSSWPLSSSAEVVNNLYKVLVRHAYH